jgi:cell division protein FtsA
MAKEGDLIVGLDIGTSKVCAVIGEVTPEGVDIIGVGSHPSRGLRRGVIVNIDSTSTAIQRAIEEAELMAGCELSTVITGIAGGHIRGIHSHGIVAVKGPEVSDDDVNRVIEAARVVAIPPDRQVIHVIPQEFIVDNQSGIIDPIGMSGVRLEARVLIITGAASCSQNIHKCIQRCGLSIEHMVLEHLAASEAVLTPEEKEMGCVVLDIGGGTTDITIWANGTIVHTSVLPVGGNHITADLTTGLRTPTQEAERLKHRYGSALISRIGAAEMIDIPGVAGRPSRSVPRRALAEIIEPRVDEIFSLVRRELEASGFMRDITSGVVLTGGSSMLDGMTEAAGNVLGLSARRGLPRGVGGMSEVIKSPRFATAVGLILYRVNHHSTRASSNPQASHNLLNRVAQRIKVWFRDVL